MPAKSTNYSPYNTKVVGYACEVTVRFYERNKAQQLTKRERKASMFCHGTTAQQARQEASREIAKQLAMEGTLAAWSDAPVPVTKPTTRNKGHY